MSLTPSLSFPCDDCFICREHAQFLVFSRRSSQPYERNACLGSSFAFTSLAIIFIGHGRRGRCDELCRQVHRSKTVSELRRDFRGDVEICLLAAKRRHCPPRDAFACSLANGKVDDQAPLLRLPSFVSISGWSTFSITLSWCGLTCLRWVLSCVAVTVVVCFASNREPFLRIPSVWTCLLRGRSLRDLRRRRGVIWGVSSLDIEMIWVLFLRERFFFGYRWEFSHSMVFIIVDAYYIMAGTDIENT